MRLQTKRFLILGICGIFVFIFLFLFRDSFSKQLEGIILGLGSVMFGLGFARFYIGRFEEKNPEEMRQNEIEAGDERNRAIRCRAQAVSGIVLQWSAMTIAWIAILFDAPLWVTLLCVGIFCGKILLEVVLMGYYQRRM